MCVTMELSLNNLFFKTLVQFECQDHIMFIKDNGVHVVWLWLTSGRSLYPIPITHKIPSKLFIS